MKDINMEDINYAIVFDMDETLGSFGQLHRFWYLLTVYLDNEDLDKKYFFNLLDLFPLFLRPNIFSLLIKIKKKKIAKICNYVMIYTNNTGQNSWANIIKSYFHYFSISRRSFYNDFTFSLLLSNAWPKF